jgi:hypothetical protein
MPPERYHPIVIVNPRKLAEFIKESEAPLVLKCPECRETFMRPHWWEALQVADLHVVCTCSFAFTVPRFFADGHRTDPGPVISVNLKPHLRNPRCY